MVGTEKVKNHGGTNVFVPFFVSKRLVLQSVEEDWMYGGVK